MEGQVRQVPAPLCWEVRRQEVPQGSVPHCGAAGQQPDDARKEQRQEVADCEDRQAQLRDHPPADRREPSPGGGERYHQFRPPRGLHSYWPSWNCQKTGCGRVSTEKSQPGHLAALHTLLSPAHSLSLLSLLSPLFSLLSSLSHTHFSLSLT